MNIKTYKTSDMSLRLLHIKKKLTFLIIVFLIVFITSFIVGRYPLTINQLLDFFALEIFDISKDVPDVIKTVVVNVRLPRILAAVLVGSALAASGAAYQGIFKNPLASPDILGASAGAAFGASLAIYFQPLWDTAYCIYFWIVSVLLSFAISQKIRTDSAVALVLTGMLVEHFFIGHISYKICSRPFDKLPAITFWLMGSLSGMSIQSVKFASVPIFINLIILYLLRYKS